MKHAIVTGAGGGIGRALVERLLKDGWSVAAVARRPADDLAEAARRTGDLRVYVGDLADDTERRDLVRRLACGEPPVDTLFNNAGVATGAPERSPQGRELHYEVNAIAPYALTSGLEDNLARARGRVVNTGSDAIFFRRAYEPDDLSRPERFRRVSGPYAASKLALALWSRPIAPRLARRGIGIVCVTPGAVDTALLRGPGMPPLLGWLAGLTAKPPSRAADLLLDAALGPYASGDFIMKSRPRRPPFTAEADRTLAVVERDAAR